MNGIKHINMDNIEISFGAYDSETMGWTYTIPEGFTAKIEDGKIIVKKEESEDERIRLKMIEHFKSKTKEKWCNMPVNDIIAWLEKQKEQKHTLKFKVGDKVHLEGDEINILTITGIEEDRYLTDCAYGPILFCAEDIWEIVEQKPTEYLSKRKVYDIMNKLTELSTSDLIPFESEEYVKIHEITSDVCGLLDYPIEQKPVEWTKYDKQMLDDVIENCEYVEKNSPGVKVFKLVEWLNDIPYRIISKTKPAEWKPLPESMEALMYAIEGKWDMIKPTSYLSRRLEDLYDGLVNTFNVDETYLDNLPRTNYTEKDIEDVKALKNKIDASMEQQPAEKQDYSGLSDLERAIHRGFLCAGVENVPVTIIKEAAQECLAQMKPAKWNPTNEDVDLFNKAITTNTALTPSERAKLDIIRMKFKHCSGNIVKPAEWSKKDTDILNKVESIIEHKSGLPSEEQNRLVAWLEKIYEHATHDFKFPWATFTKPEFDAEIEKAKEDERRKMAEWSEEDNIGWDEAFACITEAEKAARNEEELQNAVTAEKWLKELKVKYYVHPVKPEWSDEDEKMRQNLLYLMRENNSIDGWEGCYEWLKSLRPQIIDSTPPYTIEQVDEKIREAQEWSEEDELKMNALLNYLDPDKGGTKYSSCAQLEEWYNWLKSLRSQPGLTKEDFVKFGNLEYERGLKDGTAKHWKPSEEQMEALRRAVNKLAKSDVADSVRLSIMYDNLKKLM